MEARWAFLDVIVNKHYRLEDLFAFPILMPAPYLEKAGDMIEIIRTAPDLAERYAAAYTLISILMRIGTPRRLPDQTFRMIRQFVEENYPAKISAKEIAAYVHCSPTQVFRYTKKYFGLTPANYVNAIRLQKAAALIESTDQKIGDIAYDTGFDDPAYFSKLFKGAFHFSPQKYRKIYRGL